MKIGIIGAGQIGGNLARRLAALGHDVRIANSRDPQTLAELAAETGATAVRAAEAADGADLVVLAVPLKSFPKLPEGVLNGLPAHGIVVETSNYYPSRDGRIAELDDGLPDSRWVERRLGHPVVKVFNTIYAAQIIAKAKPAGTPGRVALPVAADDPAAKARIFELLDTLGFDGVDGGDLDQSWRQQPDEPVFCTDLDAAAVKDGLNAAAGRPEDWWANH